MKILKLIYKHFFKKFRTLLLAPCLLLCAFFKPLKAQEVEKANYDYLSGAAEQVKAPEEIKVLQWNVCLAGFASKGAGGVENTSERLDGIIQAIEKEDSDIVILQEVYENDAAKQIFEKLKDKYAHIYMEIGSEAQSFLGKAMAKINPFYKSGLMVLSRFEVKNPKFTSFTDIEGSQQSVNKGVFIWDFFLNNKKVSMAATHLNPSDDDKSPTQEEQTVRKLEIERIRKLLEERKAKYTYLFGDMNIDKNKDEFSSFSQNAFSLLNRKGSDRPTNAAYALKTGDERKDYLLNIDYPLELNKSFFSPSADYRILSTGFNQQEVLSDHQPTVTSITLSRRSIAAKILLNAYFPTYHSIELLKFSK